LNRSFAVVFAAVLAACGGGADAPQCEQCSAPATTHDAGGQPQIESDAGDSGAPPAPADATASDGSGGARPADATAEALPEARAPAADAADAIAEEAPEARAPEAGAADAGWPLSCAGTVAGALAKDLVARGALLLDVRTAAEYAAGHVAGAINIPVDDLSSRLGEIDPGRPIVVYCQSGARAARATQTLCDAGYKVYDLGPMSNWPG
jgi:phage shock protein E